jgi:hypothetical protein
VALWGIGASRRMWSLTLTGAWLRTIILEAQDEASGCFLEAIASSTGRGSAMMSETQGDSFENLCTYMTHSLIVTPERVVKWMLAVPGASAHALPYGSIETTPGFELVQVP